MQRVNLAKTPELTQQRLAEYHRQLAVLLRHALIVARTAKQRGGTVALEWPRYCTYWKLPSIGQFAKELSLKYWKLGGCMYGLVS